MENLIEETIKTLILRNFLLTTDKLLWDIILWKKILKTP